MTTTFLLESHSQATGGDQANAIYLELERMGFKAWYDNRASDLTKDGMLKGIEQAAAFVLFLSMGVLERPYCQLEIRHALALKKPIVLLHGEGAFVSLPIVLTARFTRLQRATRDSAASTSARRTRTRPPTCRRSWIRTSPCPSGGEGTSATEC